MWALTTTGQPAARADARVVAANRERQWKMTGAEHCNRPDADFAQAQIATHRYPLGQCAVQRGDHEVTVAKHLGEQAVGAIGVERRFGQFARAVSVALGRQPERRRPFGAAGRIDRGSITPWAKLRCFLRDSFMA